MVSSHVVLAGERQRNVGSKAWQPLFFIRAYTHRTITTTEHREDRSSKAARCAGTHGSLSPVRKTSQPAQRRWQRSSDARSVQSSLPDRSAQAKIISFPFFCFSASFCKSMLQFDRDVSALVREQEPTAEQTPKKKKKARRFRSIGT